MTTGVSAEGGKSNDYDDEDYLEPELGEEEDEEEEEKVETPSTPKPTVGLNIFTTQSTSTTTVATTTEEVSEPEILNTPPVIKSRLPKQPLTAGKPFG